MLRVIYRRWCLLQNNVYINLLTSQYVNDSLFASEYNYDRPRKRSIHEEVIRLEDQKKGIIEWAKAHKKQLTIAGTSTLAVIGIILGLKNKDAIIELWASLQKSISKAPAELPKPSSPVPKTLKAKITMAELMAETKEVTRSYTPSTIPFNVKDHLRNLPEGWHASPEKIAEAELLGIELLLNQTLVNSYMKGVIAA